MPKTAMTICALTACCLTVALANSAAASSSGAELASTGPLSDGPGMPVAGAAANHQLQLVLGIRSDSAALERFVAAVSTPGSPNFRKFLEPSQLEARFGAPAEERAAVINYLRANGVAARDGFGGFWVEADPTVAQASRLFSTHFASFETRRGQRYVAASSRVSVPGPLRRQNVDVIVGLNEKPTARSSDPVAKSDVALGSKTLSPLLPTPGRRFNAIFRKERLSTRANLGTARGCDQASRASAGTPISAKTFIPPYLPNQYLDAYGYTQLHTQGFRGEGQSVAVVEIDGFARKELEAAGACFGYTPPPTSLSVVDGGKPLAVGGETTLDLQMLAAASPGLKKIQVYEGPSTGSGYIKLFSAPLALPAGERASVISSSIGGCEPVETVGSRRLISKALQSAAALGVSYVDAAGDNGSSDCGNGGAPVPVLAIDFPAASPYITAVGGTNITLNAANRMTEEVTWREPPLYSAQSGTGGGYSWVYSRPSWQAGAGVKTARNARIVPDVAMLADPIPGFSIYRGGWISVGGTSASAPLMASGIAIANQRAASAGKPPVGFLNPSIYKLAAGPSSATLFNDVKVGTNDLGEWLHGGSFSFHPLWSRTFRHVSGRPLGCCSATKRFDAATGWGSPKMPAFTEALVELR